MKNGEDEYSDDDGVVTTKDGKPIPKFRLPKRLRGWMYQERARIPPRDVPGLLNQIKTTNITRLQTCLIDAYPESLLRTIDTKNNPPSRKPDKANFVCSECDNQEEGYDDANNVEEEEWEEEGDWDQCCWIYDDWHNVYYIADGWYEDEEEGTEFDYPLYDDNQVAYVTEEGYFIATEAVIDHVDKQNSSGDDEYAQATIDFTSARNALAKARVARGFFPNVVPADTSSGNG